MSQQQQRDPITCHILDTTVGLPARNVIVQISRVYEVTTTTDFKVDAPFAQAKTNKDGRVLNWVFDPQVQQSEENFSKTGVRGGKWVKLVPGLYKVKFLTGKYFKDLAASGSGSRSFFPVVEIVFEVDDLSHYHIPLLLSNYSYTTYRGS
ncbi:hypothetical protein CANMA_004333 [Candida margitis]|uniref:uncharacterized protein n=1 Tax=Candida margitis TaxID=1775924 RepID=UPI002227D25F|nr:uncharacterized protein CANMA_004333 [Candida margitis]KAI5957901.1 hypothetical protein CANMA_004333 [Candida margitis]